METDRIAFLLQGAHELSCTVPAVSGNMVAAAVEGDHHVRLAVKLAARFCAQCQCSLLTSGRARTMTRKQAASKAAAAAASTSLTSSLVAPPVPWDRSAVAAVRVQRTTEGLGRARRTPQPRSFGAVRCQECGYLNVEPLFQGTRSRADISQAIDNVKGLLAEAAKVSAEPGTEATPGPDPSTSVKPAAPAKRKRSRAGSQRLASKSAQLVHEIKSGANGGGKRRNTGKNKSGPAAAGSLRDRARLSLSSFLSPM